MTKRKTELPRPEILPDILKGEMSVDAEGRLRTSDGRDVAAVLLGQRGGLIGGKARAAKLSSQDRSEIARRAALARWNREV